VSSRGSVRKISFYEAPEQRLSLAEATLSRRLENGKGRWRFELARGAGEALELEGDGGPSRPPERIRRVLPPFLREGKLEPVLKLRLEEGEDGDKIEVLEGPNGTGSVTVEAGGLHDSVLRLIGNGAEPGGEPIGWLRAMLERQYAELLRHDPGIRLELDPEDVHGFRVAVRRLRAVLRASRPILDPAWSEPLRDELKWLGGALGPRRDLDVLIAQLHRRIDRLEQPERTAAETLVGSLEQEREAAQALAVEALSDDRYLRLLDALEAAARGPRIRRGEISLRKLAGREFRRLRKVADRIGPESGDEELHRARILGKRARYAAELAEPEVGKPARLFVRRAKAFQDVLGAHQDSIVAEARLRGLLADVEAPGAAFAAGRLVEAERERRAQARADLPKAWKELRVSAERAWG
jgi:CHAD domain-containing protein